ncbi:MAG: MBL fold metallo-hydrolase [Gemmatimonadota bacterium]
MAEESEARAAPGGGPERQRALFGAAFLVMALSRVSPGTAQVGVQVQPLGPDIRVGTDSIWEANSTALATSAGVVLIDDFMLRTFTRAFRERAERDLGRPVVLVINTHAHDDHTWGNQVFDGVPILAHEATLREMEARIPQMASFLARAPGVLTHLADSLKRAELDASARSALEQRRQAIATNLERHADVRITPPNQVLSADATRTIGDTELRMLALGPAHSPGDLAVFVPSLHLLVVGDLAQARGLSGLDPQSGSLGGWILALRRLVALAEREEVEHVVPGHGPTGGPEILREALAYWSALQREVTEARTAGPTREQALERVAMTEYADWTNYGLLHRSNVAAVWDALDRLPHAGSGLSCVLDTCTGMPWKRMPSS